MPGLKIPQKSLKERGWLLVLRLTAEATVFSASLDVSDSELPGLRANLEGFIDLHIHLAPDKVLRTHDDLQFAKQASKVGYRGFMIKDHYAPTVARAYDASKMFPALAISGGIVLNRAVGALNPDAVETALMLGAKEVWMPTFDSLHHFSYFGMFSLPGQVPVKEVKKRGDAGFTGITVVDSDGKIRRDVEEILGMVADADAILGTGHVSLEETRVLVGAARRAGVRKVLVTHPEFMATLLPAAAQVELANSGATLEHCANLNYDAPLTARNIKAVGAERCVLSSDSGQVRKGHPAVYMSKFIDDLRAQGITEREVRTMTEENPAKLLGLR